MNKKYSSHILITCRDPATALSFNLVLAQLIKIVELKVTVVMQSPANNLIDQINGKAKVTYLTVKENEANDLLTTLHQNCEINAFLVGVSGPDIGIDEAALAFSQKHNIKSYALQSFWGDFNLHCSAIPDTVFTLDSYATELNNNRFPKINNIEVGSIKHANYKDIKVEYLRRYARKHISADDHKIIIGFYGQPLHEVEGYIETITSFTQELKRWSQPLHLIYRAHPKESTLLKAKTLAIFEQAFGRAVSEDVEPDINYSLSACDLVVSAFSTCCIDAIYLNLASDKAINSSVFLWFEPSLIQWWQTYSQMETMPLTNKDQAIFSVRSKSETISVFELAIKEKEQARQRAINSMPKADEAVNTIINAITNTPSKF